MGTADFIVDLVSSGVTLRENRLKEVKDGRLFHSQATFIGNRTALIKHPDVLAVAQEMLERFEAHLRATEHYTVIANMRGSSPEEVAQKVFSQSELGGLQGPTISPVYLREATQTNWYAISIVVRKEKLHQAIAQLRQIGGSGVLVLPTVYIFEEEPLRWRKLLEDLNLTREANGC
jgi:ATP phosphoribosyltransferase